MSQKARAPKRARIKPRGGRRALRQLAEDGDVDAARRERHARAQSAGLAKGRWLGRGAIRGAILDRLPHFRSRHGRIAATCWISNCRRLAANLPRTNVQRRIIGCQYASNVTDRAVSPFFRVLRRGFRHAHGRRGPAAHIYREGDCLSNRLCKTRGRASNGPPVFKPTCTAVNFFHT
jgi:hypothetical protein